MTKIKFLCELETLFIILLLFSLVKGQNKCNFYIFDPKACIEKTVGIPCYYNYFENKCLRQIHHNKGCSEILNYNSCIQQLTDFNGNEVKCIFGNRCQEVNQFHLKNLGCSDKFSKYACLNVEGMCKWTGRCENLLQEDVDQTLPCLYPISVTLLACQNVQSQQCKSEGFQGEYICEKIKDEEFNQLKCDTPGLNEIGCISLTLKNQYCIFENNRCQSIKLDNITSCTQRVNLEACSKIKHLKCQWRFQFCFDLIEENKDCTDLQGVSQKVCTFSNQLCYYDENLKKCQTPSNQDLEQLTCDTIGLSKAACLKIKNYKCTFYQGYCSSISDIDLNRYKCEAELNEEACLNIRTQFEYCLWDGNKCQSLQISQEMDCPLQILKQDQKVNGNVCQAISKKSIPCKYDGLTHLCIEATSNDSCDSPFINKEGCLHITNKTQACIWKELQCQKAEVIQFKTSCTSLGFANPIACSQVHENNELGCYLNSKIEMCEELIIDLPKIVTQEILNQNYNAKQLLNQFTCTKLGINKIICASITTEGERCYWAQNQCKKVKKISDVSKIICLDMQYANFQTCAIIKQGKEPCRYFNQVKGCVNSINNSMTCNFPGLNIYACSQVPGQCYYNNVEGRCESFDENTNQASSATFSLALIEKLECVANSPSKSLCVAILTIGQLCKWSLQFDTCVDERVQLNQQCSEFAGNGINVNANVCASIIMSFPDYNPKQGPGFDIGRGYCTYNQAKAQCEVRIEACKTLCCTEKQAYGINAHTCSKFGSKEAGVYCYFNNLRCRQLTEDLVDITNEALVQQYFDANKMTCNQMGKNSCHMLTWSKKQLCFYNGNACLNLDYSLYPDMSRFIAAPAILNEYACLAIEAQITDKNKIKYMSYDPVNKFCKILQFNTEFPFLTCEDAIGNRNVCLRYTGNNYCKWDPDEYKCITMSETEVMEIDTCNYNQNIKACYESKTLACQFSYDRDLCIDAPHDVGCSYFDKSGPVSEQVCKQIIRAGQICKYDNKNCVIMTQESSSCIITGSNMIGCYMKTTGLCRWNPIKSECYPNKTEISELKCTDYLNKSLCLQVTSEACYWNVELTSCLKFKEISAEEFSKFNTLNTYNQLACFLITKAGYYFNSITNKCILLTSDNYKCQDYQMNEYACLFLTKGHKCYFDQNENLENIKCKNYDLEQTICQTKNKINIDVCMDIPRTCYFDQNLLQCVSTVVEQSTFCSTLAKNKVLGIFYNKLTCSSIDIEVIEPYGDQQCYEFENFFQQCHYEKYCLWLNYGCSVFETTISRFDPHQHQQIEKKVCTDLNGNIEYATQTCATEALYQSGFYYVKEPQITSEPKCTKTPDNTASSTCIDYADPSAIMLPNGIEIPETNKTQSYQSVCIPKSKGSSNECQQSFECGKDYIKMWLAVIVTQTCKQGVCSVDKKSCSSTCADLITYADSDINQEFPITTPQTCSIANCDSTAIDCFCSVDKAPCKQDSNCYKIVTNPNVSVFQKTCKTLSFFINRGYCLIVPVKINLCLNIYSKALCLQIVGARCFFDIKQGGCLQYTEKEDKLPSCNSFYNECKNSYSSNAICKTQSKQPYPESCQTISNQFEICTEAGGYNGEFQCSDVPAEDAQPRICSKANDDCRFINGLCSSSFPIKNPNNTYTCDVTFSKSLCEKCGCNFDFAGFCQQTPLPPQINADQSNKFYLCYEVNLRSIASQSKNCGLVDQACRYNLECEDATQMNCSDLIGYVSSSKACIRCPELRMRYDDTKLQCLVQNQTIEQCENLNKLACLSQSRKKMCIWQDLKCKEILQIQSTDSTDCSIYNYSACFLVKNLCWFDPITQLCQQFDPLKAECQYLLNEQACKLSMKESCSWNPLSLVCEKIDQIPLDKCIGLNKYSCLHHPSLPCGWSDQYIKCEIIVYAYPIESCSRFIYSTQAPIITQQNGITCARIQIASNCFLDNYYHCRETISTDTLYCNTPGVNRQACLLKTTNNCQFLNGQCEEQLSKDVGCQNYLNKQACLNQNNYCQFQSICQLYLVTSLSQIISSTNQYPYSSSVCTAFDQNIKFSSSLVYSTIQGKCLDISLRVPFIDKCEYIGINKYACLSKTNTYCIYKDQSCQTVSLKQVLSETECLENYNWKSCMILPPGCKFLNFQCMKIKETDNCQTLSSEKAIVQNTVCLRTTDVPCRFENYQCQIIKTPQKCSAEGMNYLGCIFQTKGSMCSHNGIECQYNYETVTCDEKVNEDKCLSNRSKSQFCTFDSNGCKTIDNSANILSKCVTLIKTNPTTCAQAKDYPCYYDIANKQCIYYFNPTDYTNIPINYNWINSISLNQQACEQFNIFDPVRWQDGCTKVLGSQLLYLKCNQLLNRVSCISIKTPFQYCMYVDNKCIQQNLEDYKNKNCDSIIDINNGALCQVTQNVACKYTQYKFGCEIVQPGQTIDCVEIDTESVGYNKLACLMNQSQCYYDEICFKLNHSGLQFCSDVKSFNKDTCRLITSEGCTQKNNQCVKLYNQDYFQIQCTDAINKFACVLIQTKDQYCNFNGENCIQFSVKAQKNSNCINIININHFSYCEQPLDVPCKYDQKSNSCKIVNEMEEFSCDRGLNQLACLNYTDKKLQCNFLSYCYGPNYRIQNCIQLENNDCCNEAFSIETCLFQKLYLCQWKDNKCQKYNKVENPICNDQTFSSFQVCSSILDVSCIFNIETFGCEEVISKSCDVMQTPSQCSRIKNLPCVWNALNEICLYKSPEVYEDCEDIDKLQGSQRACTNVIKEAQKCIYQDYHCLNSQEEETNNCKSNINIVLCIQQKKQPCFWKLSENLIKKFSDDQEQIVFYGECVDFYDYSITGCNSNLSYQSCLGITKVGAFCVWLNGFCTEVQQYPELIYKYNEVALVNINVCGLINDGQSVYYDDYLSTCNLADNQKKFYCNPFNPGLNRQICISIQDQNCIWENQKKMCIPQNDDAIKFIIECFSGLSYELCSQVEGTQACAILDNKCQQVNLETIDCNNIGLNKYGCLNIKKYSCIWQQVDKIHQCRDYIPYTSCLFLPNNVNFKVCQQVTEDACYYDEIEMKCASPNGKQLNCDSLGLNIIGCVQIDGCYFDQKCQKIQIQNYYCNQFPKANYKICQNAIDQCKYNEIMYGCSQTYVEQCEQKGLSQQGCLSQKNCLYLNNECICKDKYDYYNQCYKIGDSKICSQNQRCYFEIIKDSNLSSDLLKHSSVGRCRIKTCEDLKEKDCSGRIIQQKVCYLDNSNKCQSAITCEDIKNSKNKCEQFRINNYPCRSLKQFNKCKTLQCNELNEITCKNFLNQCKFTSVCEQKKCSDQDFNYCLISGCDWNYVSNRCQEQVNCYEIQKSKECNQKKQKGRQCVWVNLENRNICSLIGCRYLPKGQQCSGMLIGEEVCVELQDQTCVSCEEIQSACQCLQAQQNCYYDDLNYQCKSKTCELYESTRDCSQQYCFLEGQDENQKCLRKCDYIFNQDQCLKYQYCTWNSEFEICQTRTDEQDSEEVFNQHKENFESILKVIGMILVLLI